MLRNNLGNRSLMMSLIEVLLYNNASLTFYGITMKKTFKLIDPKIKVPRLVDAIRHEVKKYIKRERKKTLPENVVFWDFDCRFGVDEATSEVIHVSDINKYISQAESKQLESFYLEILVKPGNRSKKTIE
ncbi:MAG: DUF6172 family protein [Candidatus Marithrix sp.]